MVRKKNGVLFAALAFLCGPLAAFQVEQNNFAYTNNYGASSRDIFPLLDEKSDDPDRSIQVAGYDTDLLIGGRVRQEGFLFDKPLTMRSDYNDQYGFIRSKVNLDMRAQYGRRAYGKPAAEFYSRITAFPLWDDETAYTPILSHEVEFSPGNFLTKAEIGKHDHEGVVPFMYLDEGWVKLNAETFLPDLPCPISFKMGNFPYLVGRGISLGDYFEGGVEYLGWERKGDIGNATQRPPGVLFTVLPTENSGLELYYSKWRKRSHGPDWTREEVKAKRLDIDQNNIENIQRGVHADRDVFALRGFYLWKPKGYLDTRVYTEPYVVYVDAPELKVEYEADASARFATFGVMTEMTSDGWNFNLELAGQVGTHTMHPIDRNHLVVADSYYNSFYDDGGILRSKGKLFDRVGVPAKFNSHVLLGFNNEVSQSEYLPYRSYYLESGVPIINADRSLAQQGEKIVNDNGSDYTAGQSSDGAGGYNAGALYASQSFLNGSDNDYLESFSGVPVSVDGRLYNAKIPFGGMERFRKKYELDLRGMMAMFDMSYQVPNKRAKFSFAAAYISGDKYPFNTSDDKTYSGFIPLRDANYVGRNVTSFVMLYPRKVPRPVDMADTNLYAHNNYKTMQNLVYLGVGAQLYPCKRKDTLMLELNALSFWEDSAPYAWDLQGEREIENSRTHNGVGKETAMYKNLQEVELNFKGHHTSQSARNHIGYELNGVLTWRPVYFCDITLRLGLLFPGALYKDIAGCPNINTIRTGSDGKLRYDSLGDKIITGGMARITFKF